MNFLKRILGYNAGDSSSLSDSSDDIFAFSAEANLVSYSDSEKTEM